MKFTGERANIAKSVLTMVESHDGRLERMDEEKNLIFEFPTSDAKHDCFDTLVSINLMNVTFFKVDGLRLSVSI